MCEDPIRGRTGRRSVLQTYERRQIVVAQGVEGHESDYEFHEQWRQRMISELQADHTAWRRDDACMRIYNHNRMSTWRRTDQQIADEFLRFLRRAEPNYRNVMQRLQHAVGGQMQISGDNMQGRYVSRDQQVVYDIRIVQKRREYKQALETEGIIVVYSGHSRYGRGAVFAQYDGAAPKHGNHWGSGSEANPDEGIFRMGYPIVAVPFTDIEHHQYDFPPWPVEADRPPRRQWRHRWNYHPDARGRKRRITLPEELRQHVMMSHRSGSHRYWGIRKRREDHVYLHAGWLTTAAEPLDIGATVLRCRTFCHFGCSSREHYWNIIRRSQYKNYQRNRPPTHNLAYFTSAPSTKKSLYWLEYLLLFNEPNTHESHYYRTHEYAKNMANRRLRTERAGFYIY